MLFKIDQGIHKVKLKNALNEKRKKTMGVFFFYKYGKLKHFAGQKS